jgi:hypothetical protein
MTKLENETSALEMGFKILCDRLDNHNLHVLEHSKILHNPKNSSNPKVVEAVLEHIDEHMKELKLGYFKDQDILEQEKEERNRERLKYVLKNIDIDTINNIYYGKWSNSLVYVDCQSKNKLFGIHPGMYVSFDFNNNTMTIRSGDDGDYCCVPPLLDSELAKGLDQELIDFFGLADSDLPKGKATGSWHGECNHELAEYQGFTETYNYCKHCGKKESEI